MLYTIDNIIRDVRVALDNNMTSAALAGFGDEETLTIDDIIRSKVEDAVMRVESRAMPQLLDMGYTFGHAACINADGSGFILLPDDFMRLVVFRMSDWKRPVFTAIDDSDPEYAKQFSAAKGVRGNIFRPVCAIVPRAEGHALEFFSSGADAYVAQAAYRPWPKADANGGIDISRRCYESVVYTIASLALMTLGEFEKANAMASLAGATMQPTPQPTIQE